MTGEENYNKKKVLKTFLWLKVKEIGMLIGGLILVYFHGLLWEKLFSGGQFTPWWGIFLIGLFMCIPVGLICFFIWMLIDFNWEKAKRIVRDNETKGGD